MNDDYRARLRRLGVAGTLRRAAGRAMSAAAHELAEWSMKMAPPPVGRARPSGPPIVVHNMAKVGSKTIVASIRAREPSSEVFQTHLLTPEGLEAAERKMERLPGRFWEHLDESRRLSRRIRLDSGATKWRVISLVRDPVARDVSYFFQCLNLLCPRAEGDSAAGRLTVQDLIKLFLENLDESSPIHFVPSPLRWFEAEMAPVFGIDVFSEPFPRERGYKIIRAARADLLLLRLESLRFCAPQAFEEFLAIPDFTLVNANTAAHKRRSKKTGYYRLYEAFRREVRMPGIYLDRHYRSKLVRHFYTEEEIRTFRDRWLVDDTKRI